MRRISQQRERHHRLRNGALAIYGRWSLAALFTVFGQAIAAGAAAPTERIVFGGEADYPPFEWVEDYAARGFNVDLARTMMDEEGVAVHHELGDWPAVLRALDQGEVDAVPMFYSEARAERYHFTIPFHHVDHAIFGRVGSAPVTGVEHLRGHRVAVESRSYAHERLQDELAGVEVIPVNNTFAALIAVESEAADYAVLSAPTADHLVRAHGLGLRRMGPTIWPRPYAFAVSRDRPDLARWLDQAIQRTIAAGEFAAVYERWRAELVPGEQGDWSRWLALALLASLVTASIGGGWVLALRRTVARRTSDLRDELGRRRSAEFAARQASDYDNHGLPRSHLFRTLAAEVLETAPDFDEVLVIKLGTFEQTIRTLDYETGKELIHEFAGRVQSIGLPACGRLSRDVFAVLTRSADADELLAALSKKLPVGPLNIYPNLRFGRAVRAGDDQTPQELIRCAEIALLEAISSHRVIVTYDASMQGSQDDLRLVGEFQATEGAGLSALFQPIINVESDEIVGAEALVRWHHPELGPISPAHFVPLLEQAGLIHLVTDRMLEEAIRVASLARRVSPACCISVNVTPDDLVNSRMRDWIEQLLRTHDIPPEALKLELTETSVVSQPELVRESLQAFQALGVGLAVDDFGTGHSSLTHLTSFPFSELKIDREFVSNLTTDPRRRSIVRSTLSMARELELAVVAEGVEDQRTLTVLRHLGCDRAQGFGISKPLPEADFLSMIRSASGNRAGSEPWRSSPELRGMRSRAGGGASVVEGLDLKNHGPLPGR